MASLNAPGRLIYECRLCGLTYEPTGVPATLKALIEIQIDGHTGDSRRGATAGPLEIHNCPDGRLGMAEIVGATPNE